MSIILVNPVGDVELQVVASVPVLDSLKGKTIGYVFIQHVSVLVFWKHLERVVEERLEPKRVVKVYKSNTWAPAAKSDIEMVAGTTDFTIVGVGA